MVFYTVPMKEAKKTHQGNYDRLLNKIASTVLARDIHLLVRGELLPLTVHLSFRRTHSSHNLFGEHLLLCAFVMPRSALSASSF